MNRLVLAVSLAFALSEMGSVSAYATDILYFSSTPGSWIGQGQTVWLTSPATTFTARRFFNQGSHTNAVRLDAGDYELTIVGANYTLPTVGTYGNATRWPFQVSGPGMAFTATGRGDNEINGYFNVLQADYTAEGHVQSFAVDFLQYDERSTIDYTSGGFRYNSDVPVPEPTTALWITTLLGTLRCRRRPLQPEVARHG